MTFEVAKTAVLAALDAGDYFRSRLHGAKDIKIKTSASDLVTDVDPACERMIREQILGRFPSHTILGEESTDPGAKASEEATHIVKDADHLWIVDPLDGTTNFVHQIPLSVVSIGYAERGELICGVIYDPYRGEVFLGSKGFGAFYIEVGTARGWASQIDEGMDQFPGERLAVSTAARLEDSVVATGFPTRASERAKVNTATLSMSSRLKSLRAFGAAALHMAYVAAGRLDGFYEYDLNAWDLAAGALLVQEAGGVCERLEGGPYNLQVRNVVAAGQAGLARQIQQFIAPGDR